MIQDLSRNQFNNFGVTVMGQCFASIEVYHPYQNTRSSAIALLLILDFRF